MGDIKNLVSDSKKGKVSWRFKGELFSMEVEEIDQAIVDNKHNGIVILSGKNNNLPTRLTAVLSDGSSFDLSCPKKFSFYYLSEHAEIGISVVCVSPDPVNGWRDWHFGIDYEKKELFRHCPAY
ncbi:hypothetical protein [Marinobacter sp. V034]|uniref:hypothetical protein n=1 Tax=Marinobacter sp. V034 TaxID=3459610 RepID=UPI00404491DF